MKLLNVVAIAEISENYRVMIRVNAQDTNDFTQLLSIYLVLLTITEWKNLFVNVTIFNFDYTSFLELW